MTSHAQCCYIQHIPTPIFLNTVSTSSVKWSSAPASRPHPAPGLPCRWPTSRGCSHRGTRPWRDRGRRWCQPRWARPPAGCRRPSAGPRPPWSSGPSLHPDHRSASPLAPASSHTGRPAGDATTVTCLADWLAVWISNWLAGGCLHI